MVTLVESFTDIWSTEVMNCASATFSLCRDGNKSRRWALIGRPKSHFYFWLCGFADLCRHWQRHWFPKLSIVFWIWMLIYCLSRRTRDHFLAFFFCGTHFGIGGHFTRALTRPLARNDPHCSIILRCSQSFAGLGEDLCKSCKHSMG